MTYQAPGDRGAPQPLPSPRGAHLEMVGAVLAGDGLERVAEIASAHAGAPVAVVVPRLGVPVDAWASYERYVALRLAGGRPPQPREVVAEVPIASGGEELGAVLMMGSGGADAGEYLHVAAVAALTEVAVAEARDETEQTLRGSFLEELLTRDDLEAVDIVRRSRRLGCDLSAGAVALCADPGGRSPGRLVAGIAAERAGALAQTVGDRVYALLPGTVEEARRVAARLGRQAVVGVSSHYGDPADVRRALEEASLILDVTAAGGGAPSDGIGEGTYRLLFRVLASHPEEVRSFYGDTVAAIVSYDAQYRTDLVGTLESYLDQNCNMNATAQTIHAHRHTVGYRLERVRELTGLDPFKTEDRERLGLGLKAYWIIAPQLRR
ncbi:MAG: helix-turn-helix domain-containing protein [Thermoleophilaceae bacterium]|nr:helix-turn-helix domain-containing protein [Thermoleophilaceae bacterium]